MKVFYSSTSRPDIRALQLEPHFSQATSGSVSLVGIGSNHISSPFLLTNVMRSLRIDASALGTALLLAAMSPVSTRIVLPQDSMQSRATWSSAKRRRRLISLAAAREIAVSAMEYAESVRDKAAVEEARRTGVWDTHS